VVSSWSGQGTVKQTSPASADTPDGRTDTRFPTSSLPASRQASPQYCCPAGTSQRHGMCAHFLVVSFAIQNLPPARNFDPLTDCMQLSKGRPHSNPRLSRVCDPQARKCTDPVSAGRWPRPHFDAVHPAGGRPKPRASEEGFAFSTGQSAAGLLSGRGSQTIDRRWNLNCRANGKQQMATHNLPLPTSKAGCTLIGCAQGSTRKSYACHVHTTMELEFMRRVIALFTGKPAI